MSIAGIDPSSPSDDGLAGQGDDEIRNFKQAVKTCFPALDGQISNPGATDDPGDVNPPDAETFTALFARVRELEAAVGGGPILGEVRGFWCEYADLPAGWRPMNGVDGAPDFTGRSPIMADTTDGPPYFEGAATGGSVSGATTTGSAGGHSHGAATGEHVLTLAELPPGLAAALSIQQDTGSDGINHNDSGTVAGGNLGNAGVARSMLTSTSFQGEGHDHSIEAVGSHTHSIPAGAKSPWFALYFCVYVGV